MNEISIWFQAPEFLWLAVALVPLAVWDGWRRWAASLGRKVTAIFTRLLMLGALVLALASPVISRQAESTDVIFVLDTSKSVSDDALASGLERIDKERRALPLTAHPALVTTAAKRAVVIAPGDDWDLPEALRSSGDPEGTDIAGALELAAGLVRDRSAARVVLLSDGRQTTGGLDESIARLRARGVQVSTVVLETGRDEALMTDFVVAPADVRPGETFEGTVSLAGGRQAIDGKLVIKVDDEVVHEEQVSLPADKELEVSFEHSIDAEMEPGAKAVTASFVVKGEPLDREAQISVLGKPDILIVASALPDIEPLARVLKAEGMTPRIIETAALYEEDAPKPEDFELVILSNVPAVVETPQVTADPMPAGFIKELRRYVSRGGGLVVLGGNLSYDLGGYGKTELAKFLPVELEPPDAEIHQPVTMIIILDRSGSMGQYVDGGQTKMALTNKGAVAAMRLLRPFDNIGVMSVDEVVHWKVPVQPAKVTPEMERRVRSIYADGGGIFCYTALLEAWEVLKKAKTPLKHVILFSDAADAEEQVKGIMIGWGRGPNSFDLAKGMVEDGITTSVIGVGTNWDVDTRFLRNLARHGKGRFHITENARRLESLFVEETTQLLQLKLKEKDFVPGVKRRHPALDGVDMSRAPKLRGYVEIKAKPGADVTLTGPKDHPIMVSWQYGLGQVVTLSTDAGPRWAANWVKWDGYTKMYSQLARWALARHEGKDTGIQVEFEGTRAEVKVSRRADDGQTIELEGLRGMIREGDGAWEPVEFATAQPGNWVSTLDLTPNTDYTVGVLDDAGEPLATRRFVSPPSGELRHSQPDRDLLARIARDTGGAVELEGDWVGQPGERAAESAIWLYLAILAALLLPFDAGLRRPLRDA